MQVNVLCNETSSSHELSSQVTKNNDKISAFTHRRVKKKDRNPTQDCLDNRSKRKNNIRFNWSSVILHHDSNWYNEHSANITSWHSGQSHTSGKSVAHKQVAWNTLGQ